MRNRYITEECNKILNFWKLEEYFTPSDYPELTLTIKEGKQDIPFDAYYNAYSTRSLPLKEYKAHNEYLSKKHKSDEKLYNRANVYCGCYKIKTFVEKMAEKCKLDMEKYAEINELSGRFYIFSVQIDLDGKLTEEGVQISPFFYAVLCMIKSEDINVNIMQEDICKLNEDVNEIIYVFLTIFLYLLKCPQSLILSALRAFCFCGKPHISRSIFLYFRYQAWLKSW